MCLIPETKWGLRWHHCTDELDALPPPDPIEYKEEKCLKCSVGCLLIADIHIITETGSEHFHTIKNLKDTKKL